MTSTRLLTAALAAASALLVAGLPTVPEAAAAPGFFDYRGDLSAAAPGAVLKSRVLPRKLNPDLDATVVQVVYRTTNARHRPVAGATSVLVPRTGADPRKAVSYQSFYDSLNPEDGPSRYLAGRRSGTAATFQAETQAFAPLLEKGYTVIASDTEGPAADFAAGPTYGMVTLDSIRAALRAPQTGLTEHTRVGLIGYSGGAIGTTWAAALAPGYAPDVDRILTGAAAGGILVNPARNLRYVEGGLIWAGVFPMAMAGIARAYGIDLTPYLNRRGRTVVAGMKTAHISEVLGRYPGLTWADIAKSQFADPNAVPALAEAFGKIDLGGAPTPTAPLYLGQGAGGVAEGTDGAKAGVGPGDGVMVAGDVRSLARRYCATGNAKVSYTQFDGMSHVMTMPAWFPGAISWLEARAAGRPAPSSCGAIAPGNPLTPRF